MCTRPFGDDEVTFLSRSTVSTVDGEIIYNKNIVIDGCLLFILSCYYIEFRFFVPRVSECSKSIRNEDLKMFSRFRCESFNLEDKV